MFRIATITAVLFLSLATASAQRWEESTLPAPYNSGFYLDVFFLPGDDQKGWACEMDSGYVVRTVDGGKTWTGSRAGTPGERCHLEYIQFFASGVGYTSGPGGLFKSLNNGASWTKITLPDTVFQIWGSWFRTANEGWVTGGGCGYNAFLHTTDGGTTFSVFIDTTVKRSNMADPIWQADMPAGTVYAAGNGTLWKSTNNGASWGVDANTGPTHPWHEEITRSGNTFMVSCATSNCVPGDYAGGGVRYSTDNGATWGAFEIGRAMYGAYLLNDRTAWASGEAANVWYTEDAGKNWELRNCGLGGRHMDDITFITATNGWVVGRGIFHLAPPLRRVEPDDLSFTEICTGTGTVDTVWVHNVNFHASAWESKFTGEYDYLYRIMNPLPDPLPACDSVAILIEYRGQGPGTRRAQLEITIYDPDTTLIVQLAGTSRDLTAAPDKSLLEYNVRVGSNGDRVINWNSKGVPQETIEFITRISGDTNITYSVPLPQPIAIAPQITQTVVSAVPQDTGWIESVFRVTTAPCARDTLITVRVYGESPIINAPELVSVDVACSPDGRLRIPISNTGNLPLVISEARLEGADPGAFSVIGFTSGTPGPPWSIPVGGSDTLVLNYVPVTGNETAQLVLVNDDRTTTRGIVTPWTVTLSASANGPSFTATPEVIDLGTICSADVRDTLFRIANTGDGVISAQAVPSGPHVSGLSGSFLSIGPRTDRAYRFQWRPPGIGQITDTIRVTIAPCDTSTVIVITAMVIDEQLEISPDPLIDSTFVGGSIQRQITLTARTSGTITLSSITVTPVNADLVVDIPAPPIVLAGGEQVVVTITWTPSSEGTLAARLQVVGNGVCDVDVGSNILLHTVSGEIDVSRSSLNYSVQCSPEIRLDTVEVVSSATDPATMAVPTIVEPGTAFSVVSPLVPVELLPGIPYPIVVQYNPVLSAAASATLRIAVSPSGATADVSLTGTFTEPVISGNTVLDYGTRGACEDPVDRIVGVGNNGTQTEMMFVDATTIPAGFVVSPLSFELLPGTLQDVTVTCVPSALDPGTTTAAIVLRGGTCLDRVEITVSVVSSTSRLIITPSPVTMGKVPTGTVASRMVSISNPGARPRRIVSLTIVQGGSAWRLRSDPAGLFVAPGAAELVQVEFSPQALGVDDARLVLVDEDLCERTSSIDLRGEGVDVPAHRLDVRVDRYTVAPYTMIEIPVWFDSDIRSAQPTSIDIVITRSPLMLEIQEITSTYPDAQITTSWSQEAITIEAESTGAMFGISGPVVVIRGRAMPAIPDSTVLDILSVTVTAAESVAWSDQDGLLRVELCGPYNAIQFLRPTSVHLGAPHPVSDVLHVAIDAPVDQTAWVEIIGTSGQVVASFGSLLLPTGESTMDLPVHHVPSGTYIVRLRTSHGGVFTLPVVVVR